MTFFRGVQNTGSAVRSFDERLVAASAGLRPTGLDGTMLALSKAANHSLLWTAVTGGLVVAGGRARRAGIRGIFAVAGASAVANGLAKPLFPRRRPPAEAVPQLRRLFRPPVSSSFPSGHAASAAAFATGVAVESPALGLAVAPLALAVGYSRVHVGVHWPSDVVAGFALGSLVAVSTRRWWAVRAEEPASVGPAVEAPALINGDGLLLVRNPGSGSADGIDAVRKRLPQARELELDMDKDLREQINAAVDEHRPAALGVYGGDGTVLVVADVAVDRHLPLAAFPGGTLNHFARDVGAAEIEATCAAVESGSAVFVDLAEVTVDGDKPRTFVNTASLGGYPDSVRLREKWEPRFGKWPAAALAMLRVLAAAEPLHVHLDGRKSLIWMLFVGNGRYTPTDQVPMSRPDLNRGTIDVRYLRADMRFSRLRLTTAGLTGMLGSSPTYVHRSVSSFDAQVDGQKVRIATDGEVTGNGRSFRFASRPHAVRLYRG
ncbi:phosphatase PAP2 family protein [Skermania sp. ID1734]|uniref:bifunctional phosphatase PAP2/diacylglycerol kinase family protein n=1 Tax=Skermania sp. ID1734 TaxID=2597516 RepID=UPI00118080F7|nr:bifunctional phosphatase PAP2/diacylglycerol kinase family protein [Skermania sp. ID1734]TSE01650.1 phosphatase PAP2 family protein [Skermania sp. ID1734]